MNDLTVRLKLASDQVDLKLKRVLPGQFIMGSNDGRGLDDWTDTAMGEFTVVISKEYWLGMYPVTQGQWESVMGTNPSRFKGTNLPVEMISWHDALDFCEQLNAEMLAELRVSDEYRFTLPTEAQWEYACKADCTCKYQVGDTLDDLARVAWHRANIKSSRTQKVGQKEPNSWGFYDMLGNVMEWCLDSPSEYPHGTTKVDWIGEIGGGFHNIRGGSAFNPPDVDDKLTCSGRAYASSDSNWFFGFRVCLGPEVKPKQ